MENINAKFISHYFNAVYGIREPASDKQKYIYFGNTNFNSH